MELAMILSGTTKPIPVPPPATAAPQPKVNKRKAQEDTEKKDLTALSAMEFDYSKLQALRVNFEVLRVLLDQCKRREKVKKQLIQLSMDLFKERKEKVLAVAQRLNDKYGDDTVRDELKDQYYNMREKVEPVLHIVKIAEEAMKELGIEPIVKPIRGGTDGSQLSYMGLPCPNIFAGGHNFHGRYEYVPLESMIKAAKVIVKIAEKTAAVKID